MVAAIAILIVIGVLFGVLGLVIKGLFWLAVIGIVCVVGAIVWAVVQALRSNPRL